MANGFLGKWLRFSFVAIALMSQRTFFAVEYQPKELIAHVCQSIAKAEKGDSKLPPAALNVLGYSSPKVRHLLNNLCSLPKASYLEIGCWMGSTWIAGLYGNYPNMSFAVAIDDWSLFDGSKEQFYENCNPFLGSYDYRLYSEDCFKMDLKEVFQKPVNIYFYDGDHSAGSQELAFTYFDSVLDDVFIAVVDDWNWDDVKCGTRAAFEHLHYHVLYEIELPATCNGDTQNWWNGLYVAVISKKLS